MAGLAATVVLSSACSDAAPGAAGFETGPCLQDECFDGLSCLSNLCVDNDGAGTEGDGGPGADGGGNGPGANGDGADGGADGSAPDDGGPDDGGPDDGGPDDGGPDDGPGDDGGGACAGDPGIPLGDPCDPLAQDCTACAKCTPWGIDGMWTNARCVGLNESPAAIGEPCILIDTATSGIDNCEAGSMCWSADPGGLSGTCVELCSGSAAQPTCDTAATTCVVANDGILPLCLPSCDPLMQDCPADGGCYLVEGIAVCAPVSGTLLSGDACGSANACTPGLACVDGGGGCALGTSCCGPYCDVGDPGCTAGLSCAPITASIGACASM